MNEKSDFFIFAKCQPQMAFKSHSLMLRLHNLIQLRKELVERKDVFPSSTKELWLYYTQANMC